jgi:hypothetical protein
MLLRRGWRLIAYIFLCASAIPALFFGTMLLAYWAMTQFGRGTYLEYPYLLVGLAFCGVAFLQALCATEGMRRSGAWRFLLIVPVALCLATMINVPDIAPEDREGLREVSDVLRGLNSFSSEHGRFPATVAQLEQLIPSTIGPSPYRNGGRPVGHHVALISNASGPYTGSAGDQPGVLYYSVSGDCKESWIAVTELDRPVGGKVRFTRILTEDGFTTSLHRQVSLNWPAN